MRVFEILKKRFVFLAEQELPQILLVCGPCRSGTTAFANNFTVADVESHMQPMKSILREDAEGVSTILSEIEFHDAKCLLIKETFGAQSEFELFNPLKLLIDAGYPASKIKVVGLVREPVATYDSWLRLWGSVHEEYFKRAYRLMVTLQEYCALNKVVYLPYVPEIIRDNDSDLVLKKVVEFLNLPLHGAGITQWSDKPKFGNSGGAWPHLFFYDVPPESFISGVRNWGGYVYRDTTACDHNVPDVTRKTYEAYVIGCQKALALKV